MSLYVRLQTTYWNHRKTFRLKIALGEYALWIPLRLWSYAAEYQPDGDFTDYSPDDLKTVLSYSGDATSMLKALQDSGFMDGMKIHGWDEHNAFHATYSDRARKAADARWKKEKNQKKEESTVQRKGKRVSIMLGNAKHASSIPCKLLELNGFEEEWHGFEEMRKKKRAPMTPYAAHLILLKLSEHPDRAVLALRTAITRNWTGFEWDWMNGHNGNGNGKPQMSPEHRQNRINYLNEKKQKTMRLIKDPANPPSWAEKELAGIDDELQHL
jgi:hypothetical protein